MTKYKLQFLVHSIITLFVIFVVLAVGIESVQSESLSENENIKCVSLKILQKELKTYPNFESIPKPLLNFYGITEIFGYVLDNENNDIIIFGIATEKAPNLNIEDFVIALRNAWLKYATLKGNRYIHSYPGCSIDPCRETVHKLNAIAQRFGQSDNSQKYLDAWRKTCKEPQKVRVMGIPFNSRFAEVFVKADYDMKLIVDGTDAPNVPGLTSLVNMRVEQVRFAAAQGEQSMAPSPSMDRFWFFPGANSYEEDQGIVWIKHCPVKLLSEAMYTISVDDYRDTNTSHSMAQVFTESFSLLYDEIAWERPIYQELQNLFRFVALVNIIKFKNSHEETGINFDYFLEHFPVLKRTVAKTLPGRSAVKEFQHRIKYNGDSALYKFWMSTCGGVDARIYVNQNQFITNKGGLLNDVKTSVLQSRPTENTVSWIAKTLSRRKQRNLNKSKEVSKENKENQHISVISIDEVNGQYIVYGDNNSPYLAANAIEIVENIPKYFYKEMKRSVYINLEKIADNKKKEALKKTIKMQENQHNFWMHEIDCSDNLRRKIYTPGEIVINEQLNLITKVADGIYKGWYKLSFNFRNRLKGDFNIFVVDIITRTIEMAEAFLKEIQGLLSPHNFRPVRLLDMLGKKLRDLHEMRRFRRHDIQIKIRDNFDKVEFSDRLAKPAIRI